MWRYSWSHTDEHWDSDEIESPPFQTVNDVQFSFDEATRCEADNCTEYAFIRCAHCGRHLCLRHFLDRVCFHGSGTNWNSSCDDHHDSCPVTRAHYPTSNVTTTTVAPSQPTSTENPTSLLPSATSTNPRPAVPDPSILHHSGMEDVINGMGQVPLSHTFNTQTLREGLASMGRAAGTMMEEGSRPSLGHHRRKRS